MVSDERWQMYAFEDEAAEVRTRLNGVRWDQAGLVGKGQHGSPGRRRWEAAGVDPAVHRQRFQ